MRTATIIFPDQLFKNHPGLAKNREVFLVEEQVFFSDFQTPIYFHKKKLMLHRASMKAYQASLKDRGYSVSYIGYQKDPEMGYLFQSLRERQVREITFIEPLNDLLEERLVKQAKRWNINLSALPSPGFFSPGDWLSGFFKGTEHLSMTRFYIAQRKRLDVLMEAGKPVGGKWSFDPENRRKIPKGKPIPKRSFPPANPWIKDARAFVEKNFPDHPGSTDDFFYPVTHREAQKWLDDFLKKGLKDFGEYQDAMVHDEPFLFHSLLSAPLNIGLLTPDQIVEKALVFAEDTPVPLNSLEGFVRQIIGWREFMRAVYVFKADEERRTNFFGHKRDLPSSFYTGTTGLEPVDSVIRRLLRYAYAHHIERLMVLGNLMLLCEIDPGEIYRWFMELFIDAYDWVMVPNVYGMSQHADGGLITTKPYISSSNYIRKMSDFAKGGWCETWDGLYWRFIHKHRDFFERNPRTKLMTNQLGRMGESRLKQHLDVAEHFLGTL